MSCDMSIFIDYRFMTYTKYSICFSVQNRSELNGYIKFRYSKDSENNIRVNRWQIYGKRTHFSFISQIFRSHTPARKMNIQESGDRGKQDIWKAWWPRSIESAPWRGKTRKKIIALSPHPVDKWRSTTQEGEFSKIRFCRFSRMQVDCLSANRMEKSEGFSFVG